MSSDQDRTPPLGLPILDGVLPIRAAQVPGEVIAGLTLAALAIPEAMGYTKISGTPVITGLYTILIPTALFALFGSSRHLVVGADSATAAILAAGLAGMASVGSAHYVALAGVLALMAAALLLLGRIIGLGFMADFLSRTVLTGFLTGVGIQVALGQLSGMLGLAGGGQGAIGDFWADLQQIEQVNPYALATTLAVLSLVVLARRLSTRIPGPLIAVVVAIALSKWLDLGRHLPVVGAVPGGLPHIGLPQVTWSWTLIEQLAPSAFAMFIVILAQSAATSRAYAARYQERVSEDRDLLGLSVANIGAGLSGTFVVNGSPTKTQMLDSAGGRSQLALLVTALTVLLVLLFLTQPLAHLPDAVLAAIVFLIGLELIDLQGMRRIYQGRRPEFWVALITTLMVVVVGVEQGVLLAIVVSLIEHTRRGYRPKNLLLVLGAPGARQTRPVSSGAQTLPGLVIYRFNHSMYYANAEQLAAEVRGLVNKAEPPLRWLCIDAGAVDGVDYTAAETLGSLHAELRAKGVRMVVATVLTDVFKAGDQSLYRLFGEDAFFSSPEQVAAAYRQQTCTVLASASGPAGPDEGPGGGPLKPS